MVAALARANGRRAELADLLAGRADDEPTWPEAARLIEATGARPRSWPSPTSTSTPLWRASTGSTWRQGRRAELAAIARFVTERDR